MSSRTVLRGARRRLPAGCVAIGLALAGCLGASAAAFAATGDPVLDPQEQAVCTQINAFRASHGLPALKVSAALTRAAKWMSQDMAAHDFFDHVDSRGRDSFPRIRSFGFRNATMGENLAAGHADAAATFSQWKNEPAHRRGMLQPGFRVIGIGRAYSADTMLGWYWTTTFGAGRDRAVAC
jgi:uncharacterized protein YkwD